MKIRFWARLFYTGKNFSIDENDLEKKYVKRNESDFTWRIKGYLSRLLSLVDFLIFIVIITCTSLGSESINLINNLIYTKPAYVLLFQDILE